jgi:hypothetical protein
MLAAMSAQRYRFVVHGELGARYAKAFQGMTVWAHDGMTDITGWVIDSSHLEGLLERIAGLGLRLHSLMPLENRNGEAREHNRSERRDLTEGDNR